MESAATAWSSWGQAVLLWHLFGMLPMPGCSEWVVAWAHCVFWGVGCPWLAVTSFLRTPGGTWCLARSAYHSDFWAIEGQLQLGRWHRA